MAAIGRKLRRSVGNGGAHVRMMHWCPACKEAHGITVEGGPPTWSWNKNHEAPSFTPSVLVYALHTTDDDDRPLPAPVKETLCHYFIRLGIELRDRGAHLHPDVAYIDYCGDCPHELRGKIVELPDWPYAPGTYGGIED